MILLLFTFSFSSPSFVLLIGHFIWIFESFTVSFRTNRLNKAQIENINADTKKKEVEANKLAGVDTEVGRAQIVNLLQGVENQKAQEVLTQVQTRIGNAEANIKEMSIDSSVRYLKGLADYQEKEVERLTYDNYVSKNTADTKINMANAGLIKVYLENALTKAQSSS